MATRQTATGATRPPRLRLRRLERRDLPMPGYLAPIAWPELAWCRRHVNRVAGLYKVSLSDLWDETVTALVRATIYHDPARGPFKGYAHACVHRACWRYVVAPQVRPGRRAFAAAWGVPEFVELAADHHMWPSPEDVLIALEDGAARAQRDATTAPPPRARATRQRAAG